MREDAKKVLLAKDKDAEQRRIDNKLAKKKDIKEDNVNTLVQAKEIGLIGSELDVNELVASLENVEPLYDIKQAEDRIDNKILCVMLMEGMQRDYKGEFLPNFTLAGKLVGRSKSYMYKLWQDKAEVLAQKNNLVNNGLQMVQVKLVINLLKMTHALDSVEDWSIFMDSAGQFKNFIELFDKLLLRARLLGNMSTENVAHKHEHAHGGKVALVKTDDM